MRKKLIVSFKLLINAVGKPSYATTQSAGIDLSAGTSKNLTVKPNKYLLVPTGIAVDIPEGFEGQIRPRSGLAFKNGITVLNSPGTIDSDYTGEIKLLLVNFGDSEFVIEPGMRVAQLVISSVERCNIVFKKIIKKHTERGSKGFGSTGT